MILAQSIRGRLLLWIFLFVSCLVILLDFILLHKFQEVIFNSADNILHSKLQIVKGLMHPDGNFIEFELDEISQGEYAVSGSGHYYQVYVDNTLAFASSSLTPPGFNLLAGKIEAHDQEAREWIYRSTGPIGEPLRVLQHEFQLIDWAVSIRVAETLTESLSILNRVRRYFCVITPFFVVLAGLVGLAISSYALKPLKIFSAALEKITPENLGDRLSNGTLVLELQGLAGKFNSLLSRLQTAFESEKELIANAAHELKTPLAVIQAECDISLQKERSTEEYVDTLGAIKSVSGSMHRQINSMLTLARLDSGMLAASTFRKISLNTCLRDAIQIITP
ncbi:MAG: histidine kinase, partial [Candidatus Electrothrix sp. AR4]|nr:histidine kinase [Candidatus Electrothrix sp. AR4]